MNGGNCTAGLHGQKKRSKRRFHWRESTARRTLAGAKFTRDCSPVSVAALSHGNEWLTETSRLCGSASAADLGVPRPQDSCSVKSVSWVSDAAGAKACWCALASNLQPVKHASFLDAAICRHADLATDTFRLLSTHGDIDVEIEMKTMRLTDQRGAGGRQLATV